jgi:prolyl oligopeptidase
MMMRTFGIAICTAAAFSALHLVSAVAKPPETVKKPVEDTYHGVKVVDEYRWLEDDNAEEVKVWSDAQNAYARKFLNSLPNLDALRARVSEIMSDTSPSYGQATMRGGKYFAVKKQPPKQQPMVVVLTSLDDLASERVIIDPNELDPTGNTAMNYYQASPDGKLVAVSLSKGGSEAGDAHIFSVETGKEVFEVVPRVNTGTAGGDLAWAPDSKGFYYTRHPWPGEKPPEDLGFYQQVYFHTLGTPAKDDRFEMGKDLPRIAEIQLDVEDKTGRVLATVQNGDGGEFAHYLRSPDGKWLQFTKFPDRIIVAMFGQHDDLILVSRKDAPRGKVQYITIADLGKKEPETIIPEGKDAIMTNFSDGGTTVATPNRVYLVYQLGGPTEIRAFDHKGKAATSPKPTSLANIHDMDSLKGDDILFGSVSYLEPDAFYAFGAETGDTKKTALASKSPVSFADAEVVREFAESKDGTKVPVNIIHKKDTKLDGKNPCLANAYGGYGVSLSPRFNPTNRILLDQGFVIAIANVRGGGEYGEAWHLAGNLTKKQNVFDDFAAVLRHLVERKYTSPEHLAIIGASNGGLLMGATLTQHPDMFKVVVSLVGIYDALRSELSPNGEFNVTEFGTVKDPDQFKALLAYSPLHNVKQGAKYPPTLMLTGANDPRVEPMQSRKMIARLQAASGSESPILLRTTSNAGHGLDTPLAEQIEERTHIYAFIFEALGIKYHGPADSGAAGN